MRKPKPLSPEVIEHWRNAVVLVVGRHLPRPGRKAVVRRVWADKTGAAVVLVRYVNPHRPQQQVLHLRHLRRLDTDASSRL